MMRTNSEHSNDTELNHIELNDGDLAVVQGGAGLPRRVIDPVPALDEPALQKLQEELNRRAVLGV